MRKLIFILTIFCLCLCSCTKQADIQKVYNSGAYISIVSYDVKQFATSSNSNVERISDVGFAMVYDKVNEKMDLRNTLRVAKSFRGIRYNKLKSDNTQICLQSDDVRFVIENSGDTYIVKMYLWNGRDWVQAYAFSGCEIEASDSYEVPKLDYSSAIEQALDNNEEETTVRSDETDIAVDTYQVVEANSYDGFVSIRKEKSSQSEEIGRLENGNQASYLGTEGEWYKIEYNGVTGYVYSKYAKVVTMIDP